LSFLIISVTAQNKHNIKVNIKGVSNQEIILGYHMGDKKFPVDTLMLDKNGKGAFVGDTLLKGGLHIIILPNKTYFDFLIGNDQEFTIKTDTEDLFNTLKFEGSEENTKFLEYSHYLSENGKLMQRLQEEIKTEKDAVKKKNKQAEVEKINKAVRQHMVDVYNQMKGTFMASFIGLTMSPEVPEFVIPEHIANKDSMKWVMGFYYNKNHYWDYVNLSDERILRTPVFKNKIDSYFKRILLQIPDTLKQEVDSYLGKCMAGNKNIYQYSLSNLLSTFAESKIMGMDEMVVYLADKYYLAGKADWASEKLLKELYEFAAKARHNIIGKKAAPLKVETLEGNWIDMYQMDAKYTIVVFWEPDCGHCKKTVPKIYELYQKYEDDGVQVIAMYTQNEKEKWQEFVDEKGLHWINAWDPDNFTNFRLYYDISSTPKIFLLDEDKKILAKKIDVETLDKFLGRELKK